MNTKLRILGIPLAIALAGCQQTGPTSPTATLGEKITPTSRVTQAITPIPTPEELITATVRPPQPITPTPPQTPDLYLTAKCLEVAPQSSKELTSSGIVVVKNSAADSYDTYLLEMSTGQFTLFSSSGENQIDHSVSPNRKLVSYERVSLDTERRVIGKELVVASVDGKVLKTVPWEKRWMTLLGWLDNDRLMISYDEPVAGKMPVSFLALNPFTGESQVLRPDFPDSLDISSTLFPYWGGWYGVMYDPGLTRATYPRFIDESRELYTYGVWDLTSDRLVSSLESIFANFTLAHDKFPIPIWSPDGSGFVFQGLVPFSDHVEQELYRVSLDGQIEQLTHLYSKAYIWESSYSWSPDGRYIAMFIGPPLGAAYEKARLAVLDIQTREVTDYCLPITFGGERYRNMDVPPAPIWSPDSNQLLVQDWYAKDRSRVILVDITKGIAAQVAEDAEPVGWMATP